MRTGVAVVVGVYFVALLGLCLYTFFRDHRGESTEESRYVGTRSSGTGALVATLVAPWARQATPLLKIRLTGRQRGSV